MRQVAVFVAVLVGGGLFFGTHSQATAGPAVIAPPVVSPSVAVEAGYRRRYCRHYGCGPEVLPPGMEMVPGAELDIDLDIPAVVVLPPPRPLSCGQYRYWNGTACVDARYTDPYLGAK